MNKLQGTLNALMSDIQKLLNKVIKQIISKKNTRDAKKELETHADTIWNEIKGMDLHIEKLEGHILESPEHAGTLESIKSALESDILTRLQTLVPRKNKPHYDPAAVSSLNQKLAEEASSIKGLLDIIQFGKPGSEPPLGVKAAMHMAWGLTLRVSHEETQHELGKMFEDRFKKIWETHEPDKYALEYLEHLSAMMSASIRSMAFERDVYVGYLDYLKEKKDGEIKKVEDWADLTSFSTDGLLSRLIAIVGGGTVGSAIAELFGKGNVDASKALENASEELTKLAGTLDSMTTPEILSKLNDLSTNFKTMSEQIGSSWELVYIVSGVLAGFFIFWLISRWRRNYVIKKTLKDTYDKKNRYWQSTMRPKFKESLVHLYEDLRKLEGDYYQESKEYERIKDDEDNDIGKDWADAFLPREKVYLLFEPAVAENKES